MIIHCPNCKTQFNVDLSGIGQNGRTVRCFNCAQEWFQQPVAHSVQALQNPQPAQPAYPAPFPGYPPQQPPGYAPYPPQNLQQPGYPYPPPGYPPVDYSQQPGPPQQQAPFEDPDTASKPQPDPDDNIMGDSELDNVLSDNINALFESDDDEDEFNTPEVEPEPEPAPEPKPEPEPEPKDDISDEELDTIFDDEDEPAVISSITNPTSNEGEPEAAIDIDDIDDIPDPDPLPDSLTSDLSDEPDMPRRRRRGKKSAEPKKKSKALMVIIMLLVIIGAMLGGLYFLRPLVLQYVPALAPVYDMIGVSSEKLGDGLAIEDINYQRVTNGGVDFLIVTGNISNVSASALDIPLIQAVLSNADGEQIQLVVQEPPQSVIEPQDLISFKIEVEEPSPLARRVNVSFAPRPNDEGGEGAASN